MTVKIEVLNEKEVIDYLNSKKKDVENKVGTAMTRAAIFVEGEVKESIAGRRAETRSVDTGRFLGSVKGTADKTSAIIASDVEYAPELEYGTSKRRARRHFRNSASRNREKVSEIIEKEMKTL